MANRDDERLRHTARLLSLRGGKHGQDAGDVLAQAEGVCFTGGHKALFDLGTTVAEIRLAADGSIRVRVDTCPPANTLSALHATSQLPGNIRHARDRRGSTIVADTQINGASHLPRTLRWLREGMRQALQADGGPAAEELAAAIEKGDVARELGRLSWACEGVVEQDYGWELRPRIRGDVVPVRMTLESTCLCVTRVVLAALPAAETPPAEAIADQAIRINDQLRHARLAAHDGQLVAEARLPPELIERGWLSQTAYAVAQASRYAAAPLRILAGQPRVAETYVAVFCSTVEQPAPAGAGR